MRRSETIESTKSAWWHHLITTCMTTAWATWFWRWRYAVTRCRAWRKLLPIRCIAMQKRAVQFTKKPYFPLFLSETADTIARDYAIRKSFRHALHLVTAYLHRQNQVAQALRTRDFWLASLSIDLPIYFARRAHEYPITITISVASFPGPRAAFGCTQRKAGRGLGTRLQ